jgi:hypothetical protein
LLICKLPIVPPKSVTMTQCYKLYITVNLHLFVNKLECLSPAGFSTLVLCFSVGLSQKHLTKLERPARNTILLQILVNYGRKKFHNIEPSNVIKLSTVIS